ncbi:hypothetical protein BLOT_012452 [Blomia tropicalis]|nr:hypothetical protein BLOT_012452 [Blomia tropicalis]
MTFQVRCTRIHRYFLYHGQILLTQPFNILLVYMSNYLNYGIDTNKKYTTGTDCFLLDSEQKIKQ